MGSNYFKCIRFLSLHFIDFKFGRHITVLQVALIFMCVKFEGFSFNRSTKKNLYTLRSMSLKYLKCSMFKCSIQLNSNLQGMSLSYKLHGFFFISVVLIAFFTIVLQYECLCIACFEFKLFKVRISVVEFF